MACCNDTVSYIIMGWAQERHALSSALNEIRDVMALFPVRSYVSPQYHYILWGFRVLSHTGAHKS